MINFKMTGFVALGAAVLSFIIGLFSEVTAGALFLRALLSGILFGTLFSGCVLIIRRFLPELLEDSVEDSPGKEDEPEAESGSRLNILLDDEQDGDGTAESRPSSGPVDGGTRESAGNAGKAESSEDEEKDRADDLEELEPEAAEVSEFIPVTPGKGGAEDIEEAELLEPSDGAIPDIGVFENKFSSGSDGIDTLDSGVSGPKTIEILGSEHDPEEAAKAIKTILKKEQEG